MNSAEGAAGFSGRFYPGDFIRVKRIIADHCIFFHIISVSQSVSWDKKAGEKKKRRDKFFVKQLKVVSLPPLCPSVQPPLSAGLYCGAAAFCEKIS